jgi:hypothetical protein
MSEPTFTVAWRRASEPDDVLVCVGLTAEKAMRRLRNALRVSAPLIIESVVMEDA